MPNYKSLISLGAAIPSPGAQKTVHLFEIAGFLGGKVPLIERQARLHFGTRALKRSTPVGRFDHT
jgi:hypothetical protein